MDIVQECLGSTIKVRQGIRKLLTVRKKYLKSSKKSINLLAFTKHSRDHSRDVENHGINCTREHS